VTHTSDPIKSGPRFAGSAVASNIGDAVLQQSVIMAHNGASAVSATLKIPLDATLLDILYDTEVKPAGGTVMAVTAGNVAAGTQYAASIDVFAGGRFRGAFTVAQLAAWRGRTTEDVVITMTPTGTMNAGRVRATVLYARNL